MKLVFVYNAKSGLLHGMMDAVHKVASPQTYPCSLCALTYGAVSMKRQWKDFLARLPVITEFAYKAEFQQLYPAVGDDLPAIYRVENDVPQLLMSRADIGAQPDVNALMAALSARLDTGNRASRDDLSQSLSTRPDQFSG